MQVATQPMLTAVQTLYPDVIFENAHFQLFDLR